MIVSRQREKLINAINFFVRETAHCHTLKLFKLLHFLDFEHFRQTGRTVTGLQYQAFPKGPVPPELLNELREGPKSDLRKSVLIVSMKDDVTDALLRRDIKPIAPFDSARFSKREMAIMKLLADFFKDLPSESMSDFSHLKNLPWRKIYGSGEGKNKPIPTELALESEALDKGQPTIDSEERAFRKALLDGLS